MVSTKDIIDSIMSEIKDIVPDSEHYPGGIREGYKAPAFSYIVVYNDGERISRFVQDITLDLQIVYFASTDGYGSPDPMEKLEIAEKLKQFLNRFELIVGDRVLKFEYEVKDADEKLAIFMTFHYRDGVCDNRLKEADAMESVENVYFKERVK